MRGSSLRPAMPSGSSHAKRTLDDRGARRDPEPDRCNELVSSAHDELAQRGPPAADQRLGGLAFGRHCSSALERVCFCYTENRVCWERDRRGRVAASGTCCGATGGRRSCRRCAQKRDAERVAGRVHGVQRSPESRSDHSTIRRVDSQRVSTTPSAKAGSPSASRHTGCRSPAGAALEHGSSPGFVGSLHQAV